MTELDVTPFRTSSVAYLHGIRKSIKVDPIYQRQGEVWSRKNQQLLIDSIINRFDVPKIYFHEHHDWIQEDGRRYKYSLVDGRQRLEAIWDFLDGRFALSDDFQTLADGSTDAAGKNYEELKREHPEIAAIFAATSLDVMLIRTSDVELIEEMFSRLNEAMPLNAAEKRNGRGGPLREATRQLVASTFFADRVPFSNSRFRHLDLATKFLVWADAGNVQDVKKRQLDDFWDDVKSAADGQTRTDTASRSALATVELLSKTFTSKDRLLASVGMVSVYFLLYQKLTREGKPVPTRAVLQSFEDIRRVHRPKDEESLSRLQRRLLEFDRLSQSPNDAGALRFRLEVLEQFVEDPSLFAAIPEESE